MPSASRAVVDLTKDDDSEDEAPRHHDCRPKTKRPDIIEISDSESPSPRPTPLRSSSKNAAGRADSRKRDGGHMERERHASKRVSTPSTRPDLSGRKTSTPVALPKKTSPVPAQNLTASKFAPRKSGADFQANRPSNLSAGRPREPISHRSSTSATHNKPSRDTFTQNVFPNLPGASKSSVVVRTTTALPPVVRQSRIRSPISPAVKPSANLRPLPGEQPPKKLSKNGPEQRSGLHENASLSTSTSQVGRPSQQEGPDNDMIQELLLKEEDRRSHQSKGLKGTNPAISDKIDTRNTHSVSRQPESLSKLPVASGTNDKTHNFVARPRHKEENVEITTAEIEELLKKLALERRETHAVAVNVLLEDARTEARAPQNFIDEVSPFASMTSVEVNPDDRKSRKGLSEPVDTFVSAAHG
jgi:hypothetical protein